MSLNVIFMGTPDFAVPALAQIVSHGHNIVAVYSQPPRPAGRGMVERKSPVHEFAVETGIEVLTPKSLKGEAEQKQFAAFGCDVAIVVAYGLILPGVILDAPGLGCFNLHASLLPRWRGAAPIQRAIMAGDAETGIMVMRMEEGLDTGPICLTGKMNIAPDMTAGELHDNLALRGGMLLAEALERMELDRIECVPQNENGVTYARKIDKSEARIDWTCDASEIHNLIRGLSPFPGAWCEIECDGKTQRVKILKSSMLRKSAALGIAGEVLDGNLAIACGAGGIRLHLLQRAGKKAMNTDDFLRGLPVMPGDRLS